jgi:hypothetical protein
MSNILWIILGAITLIVLVLYVVDYRLRQITIAVPKPEVIIHWPPTKEETKPETGSEIESFVNFLSESESTDVKEKEEKEEKEEKKTKSWLSSWFDKEDQMKVDIREPFEDDSSGNLRPPAAPGIFGLRRGPTNYPEPREMSAEQRRMFMWGYPADMTMQDYINWLWLYRGANQDALDLEHRVNLDRLLEGRTLNTNVPPSTRQVAPLNGQDYFLRQYPDVGSGSTYGGGRVPEPNSGARYPVASEPNTVMGSVRPANVNQYANQADNWDVWGQAGYVVNPELGRKVDAAELTRKVTPQIQTPPPPPDAPAPVDPSVSPPYSPQTYRDGN